MSIRARHRLAEAASAVLLGLALGIAQPAGAHHGIWINGPTPLTVERHDGIDVDGLVAHANSRIGADVFVAVAYDEAQGSADVEWIAPWTATYVKPSYGPDNPCFIYLTDGHQTNRTLLTHELMHCLGLADHVWSANKRSQQEGEVECDGPDAHPYEGVMSYCTSAGFYADRENPAWWGPDDVALFAPWTQDRLAGEDRYHTATLASRLAFTTAETVVVANGNSAPDLAVAAALASSLGAPLLLVRRDELPEVTRREVERLGPSRVVVVGGTGVVGDNVVQELTEMEA